MRGVTKRRMMLGAAGVLISLAIGGPVGAAGTGHGQVDVNDVTSGTRGGLIEGSDGNERNLNYFNVTSLTGGQNTQITFNYEEAVEFNGGANTNTRVNYYDERFPHPEDPSVGNGPGRVDQPRPGSG